MYGNLGGVVGAAGNLGALGGHPSALEQALGGRQAPGFTQQDAESLARSLAQQQEWYQRNPRPRSAYIGKVTPKPGVIKDGNDYRWKTRSDYSWWERAVIWWNT